MELTELRKKARASMNGFCRVCPICDGRACAGEVPGMGGVGSGAGFTANLTALARWRLNMRTIHAVQEVDTSITLFGQTLSMPVLAAPMTGVAYNMGGKLSDHDFAEIIIDGSLAAGTLGSSADGVDASMFDAGITSIALHGGKGIPFVKPRAKEVVLSRIRDAKRAGAVAMGMDVDGAGIITMALKGQPVGPKSFAELAEIIGAAGLPFIIKGIMTPDEAVLAVDAGAAAIVVSNHGGRAMDHTPGVAEVLPAIAARVRSRGAVVLADGGVRSGVDVLKLLALGAHAVLVGRPLTVGAFGNGSAGVAMLLNKMRSELVSAMLLTGTAGVTAVSPDILTPGP